MKIESLIKRTGGTVIDMDAPKRQYHFKPADGQPHESPHVAIVGEPVHAKALLRIREGFRLVDGEIDPDSLRGDADGFLPHGAALTGSNIHNASYDIAGGDTVQLGELVVMAFQDSGLSYEQWEELADQERYDYIDATLAELKAGEGNPDDQDGEQQPPVQQKEQAPVEPPAPAPVQEKAPAADQQKPEDEQANDQDGEQQQDTPPAPEVKQDAPATEQDADEVPLAERPRKELVALYKTRFGREPSTRMTIPDIAAALAEDDD